MKLPRSFGGETKISKLQNSVETLCEFPHSYNKNHGGRGEAFLIHEFKLGN
jgi:hypothetical protein